MENNAMSACRPYLAGHKPATYRREAAKAQRRGEIEYGVEGISSNRRNGFFD
jgi:hypothetical protein